MAKSNEASLLPGWPRNLGAFLRDDVLTSFVSPGVSLSEDEDHVYVEAAVPGMKTKDVSINYSHGMLSINAEHREEEGKGRKYYRTMQRSYNYQIALPVDVEEQAAPKASLKDGVLKVTFTRSPETKPRKIEIEE